LAWERVVHRFDARLGAFGDERLEKRGSIFCARWCLVRRRVFVVWREAGAVGLLGLVGFWAMPG